MWEVFSNACEPYGDHASEREVWDYVQGGGTLPAPAALCEDLVRFPQCLQQAQEIADKLYAVRPRARVSLILNRLRETPLTGHVVE